MITGIPELPVSWIGDSDRFWYRVRTEDGYRFILVDPDARSRRLAFDHGRLASALSAAADTAYDPTNLPFRSVVFSPSLDTVSLDIGPGRWRCVLTRYECMERAEAEPGPAELASPRESRILYRDGFDLWMRELGDTTGIRLTEDGEQYLDYGTSPEGNTSAVTLRRFGTPVPPAALWSPDGRFVATHRLDQRRVEEMHLVQSAPEDGSKRPRHFSYRYALPGDTALPLAAMTVIDTEARTARTLDADPLLAVYQSPITFQHVWWSEDSRTLYYLRFGRGDRSVALEAADPETGAVRRVLLEECPSHCDVAPAVGARPNVRVLGTGEVLWWSQRDGWGHLYLYDGATGELQRQVTSGPWLVRNVLHVDEEARTVWLTGSGREEGDPYLQHLYSVSLDGGQVRRLTPEGGDHRLAASPSGRYFVDVSGSIGDPPAMDLRDRTGQAVLRLEEASLDGLLARGWAPPEPVVTKARDGSTDLHGLLLKPTGFDPERRYPVIEYAYPGPQTNWVPKSLADPLAGILWDAQATAELGAIVVLLDGMGTPYRSKAFQDVSYGNLEDAGGLADHVSALKQLAATRSYMDLDRVGIYGFSGGGFMSTHAILTHPDFYKVAVSGAGNHDQRGYIALWGEKYHGLLEDDGQNYVEQANPTHAANLQGKLLLIHGDMDDNVSPALTLQLVDALVRANRDFDLLLLPNLNHGAGAHPYYIRRRWDYFVEHLLGARPPKNYQVVPS